MKPEAIQRFLGALGGWAETVELVSLEFPDTEPWIEAFNKTQPVVDALLELRKSISDALVE